MERKPSYVELRLPPPSARTAMAATGGRYGARTELSHSMGAPKVVLEFQ